MRALIATLADYANVREGLLNIVSAGVTQMGREAYPAPIDCHLAILLDLGQGAVWRGEEIRFRISVKLLTESGESIGDLDGELNGQATDSDLTLPVHVPLAVPLPFTLPSPGLYTLDVRVDDQEIATLVFRARDTPRP